MKKLLAQVGQPLPVQDLIVVEKQGRQAVEAMQAEEEPELMRLIRRANHEMRRHGANLWSVNPSKNHYFVHGFGDAVRARAKKTRIFKDFSCKLGLVYGAFFGFRALHEQRRYTRYGQVKDDVERSLRYWHYDGVVLRFNRYAVLKDRCKLVGKFHVKKGGISADSSADQHKAEATRALVGILEEFASKYARLAKPEEPSSCGLIWRADSEKDFLLGSGGVPGKKRSSGGLLHPRWRLGVLRLQGGKRLRRGLSDPLGVSDRSVKRKSVHGGA